MHELVIHQNTAMSVISIQSIRSEHANTEEMRLTELSIDKYMPQL